MDESQNCTYSFSITNMKYEYLGCYGKAGLLMHFFSLRQLSNIFEVCIGSGCSIAASKMGVSKRKIGQTTNKPDLSMKSTTT